MSRTADIRATADAGGYTDEGTIRQLLEIIDGLAGLLDGAWARGYVEARDAAAQERDEAVRLLRAVVEHTWRTGWSAEAKAFLAAIDKESA